MCGISGFVPSADDSRESRAAVERMNHRLAHRGPDNTGVFSNDNLCLGHTRLSIIDLSPEANQPFTSDDGRFVIVYNGELYNYKELRLELQRAPTGSGALPYFFTTKTDTEVVVAAFVRWGIGCIQRFNGMYAFAVYDRHDKKLWLVRDRMGVKPLYYHYGEEGLVFASEIRAILNSGIKKFRINRETISEYLLYQTVHAPNTIVKGVSMLMPGHYMEFENGKASITRYYDLNSYKTVTPVPEYKQVCAQVFQLLGAAVQRRMVADVPFGAFLSGGIDSSAVVALMSTVGTAPINTFNVSFDEGEFSEARYAEIIAKKYNTRHHSILLRPTDFLEQLPDALAAMDHPSGDGPNTYVVARATKQAGITMALSGIGGDELFAGYPVFSRLSHLNRRGWITSLPLSVRKIMAAGLRARGRTVGDLKRAELLSEKRIDFASAYKYSRTVFTLSTLRSLGVSGDPFATVNAVVRDVPQEKDHFLTAVSLAETGTYLQNVLLRDTDQMSMAVALEVREPFLDHNLFEFVLGVPDHFKFPVTPKKLLTDSLGDLLPAGIANRPKMGFTLPWQQWMKQDLKALCEAGLRSFAELGLGDEAALKKLWARFLAGDATVTWSRIWHIVVLGNWIRTNNVEV